MIRVAHIRLVEVEAMRGQSNVGILAARIVRLEKRGQSCCTFRIFDQRFGKLRRITPAVSSWCSKLYCRSGSVIWFRSLAILSWDRISMNIGPFLVISSLSHALNWSTRDGISNMARTAWTAAHHMSGAFLEMSVLTSTSLSTIDLVSSDVGENSGENMQLYVAR